MKAIALSVLVLSAAGLSAQTVYTPGSGVTYPEVIKDVKPAYTAAAMRAGIQGSVELETIVGVSGRPERIRVVRSLDTRHGLDDKAVAALRGWVFKPGRKDGKAVPVRVKVEMTFSLRDRK
jgi:periplasmic protein TonB